MKKMMIGALVAAFVTSSAFAGVVGKITAVDSYSQGAVYWVTITPDGGTPSAKKLVGADAESFKRLLAQVLSAQASGATVDGRFSGTEWTGFSVQ